MKLRNIEVKIPVEKPEILKRAIEQNADGPPQVLNQKDTYLDAGPDAYLKVRQEDNQSMLITYRREREAQLRPSDIRISFIQDGTELISTLAKALPIMIEVTKKRLLYFQRQTRIHLDHVQSLGWFLELEVVLRENQTDEEGLMIAHRLLADLGMSGVKPCRDSYRDLLLLLR